MGGTRLVIVLTTMQSQRAASGSRASRYSRGCAANSSVLITDTTRTLRPSASSRGITLTRFRVELEPCTKTVPIGGAPGSNSRIR